MRKEGKRGEREWREGEGGKRPEYQEGGEGGETECKGKQEHSVTNAFFSLSARKSKHEILYV